MDSVEQDVIPHGIQGGSVPAACDLGWPTSLSLRPPRKGATAQGWRGLRKTTRACTGPSLGALYNAANVNFGIKLENVREQMPHCLP